MRVVEDDHVDRLGVEARQRVQLTSTNHSIGLIALINQYPPRDAPASSRPRDAPASSRHAAHQAPAPQTRQRLSGCAVLGCCQIDLLRPVMRRQGFRGSSPRTLPHEGVPGVKPGDGPCGRSFISLFFAGLVTFAGRSDPIPSRTRPSNAQAPMVLCLKTWESRSLPGPRNTANSLPIPANPPAHAGPSSDYAPARIRSARGGAAR